METNDGYLCKDTLIQTIKNKVKVEENNKIEISKVIVNSKNIAENSYQCEICKNKYASIQYLRVHQRIHTGEKPYKCDTCSKTFNQRTNLVTHQRIHNGMKPFNCDFCIKSFTTQQHLIIHTRRHTGEKPFKCKICSKEFRQQPNLKRHMQTHTGEKPHKCKICKENFSTHGTLAIHNRIHSGEKPFQCQICSKKFTQKSNLIAHMRIHSGEKPFKCELCRKKFNQNSSLISHTMRVHNHTDEESFNCQLNKKFLVNENNFPVPKNWKICEKSFMCKICFKRFNQIRSLSRHNKIHDDDERFQSIGLGAQNVYIMSEKVPKEHHETKRNQRFRANDEVLDNVNLAKESYRVIIPMKNGTSKCLSVRIKSCIDTNKETIRNQSDQFENELTNVKIEKPDINNDDQQMANPSEGGFHENLIKIEKQELNDLDH